MKKIYKLTRSQIGVLYAFDENGNVVFTNKNFVWGHLKINQKIDFNKLNEALNYCFKKNDSIRIKLCQEDNKLFQYFEDYREQNFEIVDVNTENDVKKLENDLINRPFEMFNSFLFQLVIYKYKNGFGGVILKVNHVIADGYTLGLLLYEVLRYLSKKIKTIISFSYLNYIKSEEKYPSSRRYRIDKEYWEKMFENGIPDIAYIPSNKEKYSFSKANKIIFDIDDAIVKIIKNFCKIHKVSNNTFYTSIYSIYIYKKTSLTNFFLATASKNRRKLKEKFMAGMLSNTAYFNVQIKNERFDNFMQKIHVSLKNGYQHMNYINNYTRELFEQYNDNRKLPTNVILSYQNLQLNPDKLNINFEITGDNNVGTYGSDIIIIHIFEYNNKVKIIYDYLEEKYSIKEIEKLNDEIINIIRQVNENNGILINDIEM